jgi:ELWxxDGT repeat protein
MKIYLSILFFLVVIQLSAEDVSKIYNIISRTDGFNPGYTRPLNEKLYFVANDGVNGYEFWACDSNNNITRITGFEEIPNYLIKLNNRIFYFSRNGFYFDKLWKFDGVNPPENIFSDFKISDVKEYKYFAGKLYIYVYGGTEEDSTLWEFNGYDHPKRIACKSIYISPPTTLTVFNNKLYFLSKDDEHGNELWSYDTLNPPSMVTDINVGPGNSNPQFLRVHDNKLYFVADDGVHGQEMWVYDGINEPKMIADIKSGSESSVFPYLFPTITYKNKFYFRANDGIHDHRIWSYDGTNPPQMIDSSGTAGFPADFFIFKDKLYFHGYDRPYLYEYDGSNLPKPLIQFTVYDRDDYKIFNDNLYFSGEDVNGNKALWKYDGVNPPIDITQAIPPNLKSQSIYIIPINNRLFFSQDKLLWTYNNDSVSLVSDNFGPNPTKIGELSNRFYYCINDPLYGTEIWSFDGTSPPSIISDINKTLIVPESLKMKGVDNKIYFTFTDSAQKYVEYDSASFKTLSSGFNPNSVYNLLKYNGNSYYNRATGRISASLFKFDGTTETAISSSCGSGGLTVFNNALYYGINYEGLYKYDGINPSAKVAHNMGQNIIYQKVFNNKLLLFTADIDLKLMSFWAYDGINLPVKINSTLYPFLPTENNFKFIDFNGKFYYVAKDAEYGSEMWVYDESNPPAMLSDINYGAGSSTPKELTVYKNKLYFSANDELHGNELWVYDGLNAPHMVEDIESGSGSSSPEQLCVSNNKLYFIAYNNKYGTELWGYDGINQPAIVSDIYMGTKSSNPTDLIVYKNNLYFSAVTEKDGRQLYKVCFNCSSVDTIVCEDYCFNGNILNASGRFYDTIPNCSGGDSIIILNLKINHRSKNSINIADCETYISPSGKIFTTSGVYTDTIPNEAGCDSIITVKLTIKSTASTIHPVVCNSYTSPSGKYVWKSSGTFMDTIPNVAGCDSVITVNLTINSVDISVTRNEEVLTANATNATYQWIDCDDGNVLIEEETNKIFIANTSGNYAVIVSNGVCKDTSACYFVNATSLTKNSIKNGISLHPNPTSGHFTIDLGKVYEETTITITELDGRLIKKKLFEGDQNVEINLDTPAGIYLVTITTAKENLVFRIVKN